MQWYYGYTKKTTSGLWIGFVKERVWFVVHATKRNKRKLMETETTLNYVFMIGRHKIVNGIWRRRRLGGCMPGQWGADQWPFIGHVRQLRLSRYIRWYLQKFHQHQGSFHSKSGKILTCRGFHEGFCAAWLKCPCGWLLLDMFN